MTDKPDELEAKFSKSKSNRQTENAGLAVLLRDPRFQAIDRVLKRQLLEEMGIPTAPVQAFDAVIADPPVALITAFTLPSVAGSLRLVEMKTTRKAIQDDRLEGFFFGVTESEFTLAASLPDRYLFAFVVLNQNNIYGAEFFVLLTYAQLIARIKSKRTQFQVTLARGLKEIEAPYGSGPGELQRPGDPSGT